MNVLNNKENNVEQVCFDGKLMTSYVKKNLLEYFDSQKELWVKEAHFNLVDIVALAAYFDCEFAAYKYEKRLYIKKGEKYSFDNGIAGRVCVPKAARMLLHTHPTYNSIYENFEFDKKNCCDGKEVVVDYAHTIIVYDKHQVFNSKNEHGFYRTATCNDYYWPNFLSRNEQKDVCIII